ncbi:MAG: type ISP restriction/modification enzyme [Candidatus Omnitrophota bacterium]
MLKEYLKQVFEVAKRGDATEVSFYSTLAEMLQNYAKANAKNKIQITTLPKQTEAGNPDFRIWDGKQQIVGYIEAKDPSIEDLDRIENTPQLKRYRDTFPNLILTNFFEFRLYRDGTLINKVQIGRPFILRELNRIPPPEKEDEFKQLLEKFLVFSLPKISTAKSLAVELAKRTRFLKEEVLALELKIHPSAVPDSVGEDSGRYAYASGLEGFYEAFQKYLINGLTRQEFIDLYAQTITYGLFAARTRSGNTFNRKLAYDNIPHTIGILRDVFRFISLGELPQQMEWIIDDISEVLAATDVNKILHQYFHEGKGKDPIIHFYETFLAEYDPKTREKRGVYYTPEPVVSYIVRSIQQILKKDFGRKDGLANENVTVLDPAAGTLTFLAEAAKLAVEEYVHKYGEGGKGKFIKEHILKNYYAFELMMAPYAIGHLKMSFLLEELGYTLKGDDRFNLYLTNTLEMEELSQSNLPGMASLSEESRLAGKVKKEIPILVVMGNPPYSVSSANKSKFINGYFEKKDGKDKKGKERKLNIYVRGILDDYKEDVKDETNISPLSDDYIKFIRFAQWKIDQAGVGVIGMITNNSYLSGLIHRGMRKKLMESFDKIYLLNLHGNSRIGEKCPDNSKDENVFDIMQGVSIALFVKTPQITSPPRGEGKGEGGVFYHDLYGLREQKYDFLKKGQVKTTKWTELQPTEPYYFFVEKDFTGQAQYDKFVSIPEIFKIYSSGVKTHRDHFVVGFTENEVKQKIRTFVSDLPDDLIAQGLQLKNTRDWNLKNAREAAKGSNWNKYIRSYSYRPFDIRQICYLPALLERGCDRLDLMQHFFQENVGLVVSRQFSGHKFFTCFCTQTITDISSQPFAPFYVFPLYLYPDVSDRKLPGHQESEKKPNLKPEFRESLTETFGHQPTPEEVFYYIYAVLYSNTYRLKYAEFLKIDFPRIPFTLDYRLFQKMGILGNQLIDLHLLKSPELDPPIAKFEGEGDFRVEKVRYEEKRDCRADRARNDSRVYINKGQYFAGIPKEVWEYRVGGYQVCDKWLKDRKGRALSLEDIKHYCAIVTALQKTIEIQKEIDALYPKVEK